MFKVGDKVDFKGPPIPGRIGGVVAKVIPSSWSGSTVVMIDWPDGTTTSYYDFDLVLSSTQTQAHTGAFKLGEVVDRRDGSRMAGKVIFVYATPNYYKVEWPTVSGIMLNQDEIGTNLVLAKSVSTVAPPPQRVVPKFRVGDLVDSNFQHVITSYTNGKINKICIPPVGEVEYTVDFPGVSSALVILESALVPAKGQQQASTGQQFTTGNGTWTVSVGGQTISPATSWNYQIPGGGGGLKTEFPVPTSPKVNSCECGAEKCGSNSHSSWCGKYQKEMA